MSSSGTKTNTLADRLPVSNSIQRESDDQLRSSPDPYRIRTDKQRTMDLDGHTALVTGSSRNIGQAIAERLAEAGADVGITAHKDRTGCEETATLVENAGATSAIAMGDLAEPADIESVVESIRDELGPIDILVNNASYRPKSKLLDVTPEEWAKVHNIDLRAMFLLSQLVVPDMLEQDGGAIVNIVGKSIYTGLQGKTHVIANKAGIPGLTRALALELGEDNIRVNALCLGLINTDRDLENYDDWESHSKKTAQMTALKRNGEPKEVADVCCFLASQRASYVTGQVLHVNGGSFPISDLSSI